MVASMWGMMSPPGSGFAIASTYAALQFIQLSTA